MEEMGDNARVWRVYLDETDQIDAELVNSWRSTLDTLLIFAGLFSAVVATFVTQTTQLLQTDNSEVTASLLTELVGLQRAIETRGNVSTVLESSLTSNTSFKPTLRDIWLNGLWLASLGLTLMTALLTGLIKQWLNYYISDAPGSPKRRACIRQFRFKGVTAWGVSPFVELLPVLMNTSLFLFFAGLILFSQGLTGSEAITLVIIVITSVSFAFYLGTSALPIFWPQCPYKTSLTSILYLPYVLVRAIVRTVKFLLEIARTRTGEGLNRLSLFSGDFGEFIGSVSLPQGETTRVQEKQDTLEIDVIKEMLLGSPHPVVSSIAAQALASLCLDEPIITNKAFNALWVRIDQIFTQSFVRTGTTSGKKYELLEPISTIERLARALAYYPFCISGAASERLAAFIGREPGDIRLAALQAFTLRFPPTRRRRDFVAASAALTRRFLETEDIETSRLHPWQRRQLSYAAATSSKMGGFLPNEQDAFFRNLLQHLNLDTPPFLQQEMSISLLSPETTFDQDIQSSGRVLVTGSPLLDLSKRFLQALPQLTRYALSTIPSRSMSKKLFCLLRGMLKDAKMVYVMDDSNEPVLRLRVSVWGHVYIPMCVGNHEAPEAVALVRLLQELASDNTQDYDWTEVQDRISLILCLHWYLYRNRVFNQSTFEAVLYWAMTLSSREWRRTSATPPVNYLEDTPSNATETEAAEEASQGRRLRAFISRQILQHSPQAIESFCSWVISNGLFGLPSSLLFDIGSAVRELLQGKVALSAANSLDRLFIYLLTKSTISDAHSSPSRDRCDDQQRTLADFIGIVSDADRMSTEGNGTAKGLLKKLQALLVRSKAREEKPEADTQAKPGETGLLQSNEVNGLNERNLAAGGSLAISLGISVPALLQLVEAALNSSAEQGNRGGQCRSHPAVDLHHPFV